MKGTNLTEKGTVRESFSIKMEDTMKGNGEITKWMGGENFIMMEENWHMKEIGVKISSMV